MTNEIVLIIKTVFLSSHLYATPNVYLIHQFMFWRLQLEGQYMLNPVPEKVPIKIHMQ